MSNLHTTSSSTEHASRPPARAQSLRRAAPGPFKAALLWLLLGASLNILITWSLGITFRRASSSRVSGMSISDPRARDWPYSLVRQDRAPDQFIRSTSLFTTMDTGVWDRLTQPFQSSDSAIVVVNTGFPFRSMRYHFDIDNTQHAEVINAWRISNRAFSAFLPLRPIWTGFILDALLISCLGWSIFSAPRTLQRFLRARRLRCLACGYDRAGLPTSASCPECGLPAHP
jgi:hypothetical protein